MVLDQFEPLTQLTKDLRNASKTLAPDEARFMVDAYYQIQQQRVRLGNQIRSQSEEPHELLRWFYAQMELLEKNVQKALDGYSKNHPVGTWLRTIMGIGPVLASGFLAHIDITKAPTAGHIHSFAGLVPGVKWEKGQKRPWNADLKRLCWIAGESFVKVQSREKDVYGHIYAERKRLEQEANLAGMFADQAAAVLESKRLGKDTVAYKYYAQGMLPPAHIHARAKRYSVKLFISHLHEVWYITEYHEKPARPYVIEHLGHVHYFPAPGFPLTNPQVAEVEDILIDGEESMEEEATDLSLPGTLVEPKTLTLAEKLERWKNSQNK